MFANGLMLPHFDYLDTIYCKANKTKLNDLDILYKKVAKIALGVKRTESSMTVYKDMKWLPLHLRRQVHLSLYVMFKFMGLTGSLDHLANNLHTRSTALQKHLSIYTCDLVLAL